MTVTFGFKLKNKYESAIKCYKTQTSQPCIRDLFFFVPPRLSLSPFPSPYLCICLFVSLCQSICIFLSRSDISCSLIVTVSLPFSISVYISCYTFIKIYSKRQFYSCQHNSFSRYAKICTIII